MTFPHPPRVWLTNIAVERLSRLTEAETEESCHYEYAYACREDGENTQYLSLQEHTAIVEERVREAVGETAKDLANACFSFLTGSGADLPGSVPFKASRDDKGAELE